MASVDRHGRERDRVSALSSARTAVAAALAGVGVPVFDQQPGSVQPPCLVLVPGRPWIVPRGAVNVEIVAHANPASGNSNALTDLEDLVEAVRNGLWAAGLAPGDTDPPEVDSGAGSITARTPVTVRTDCH
jgi:hypothetical protein